MGLHGNLPLMDQRHVIHIADADSRTRAELSRRVLALGHHAEVYAGVDELRAYMPDRGLALIRDDARWGGVAGALKVLAAEDVPLPVIAMAQVAETGRVVAAIRAGALDFLALPASSETLGKAIDRVAREMQAHSAARVRLVEARRRVGRLTKREHEVLDWLTEGHSNKAIARELAISPRTVEIHRANMMAKLEAKHPADAVRIRLETRKKRPDV